MSSKPYKPQSFENKVIEFWQKEKVYKTKEPSSESPKKYLLSMFPYPSGAGLHVGHVRIYTGTDVLARFYRMKGYSVLHPMGWDAFGLPAENAAIKAKKNPMDMVPKNIQTFKKQMQMLGLSYDWEKEFTTTDPDYYKWTQWLFIQFFKMGLLYKKDTPVYYCEFCKTGLAEEEVLPNGTHERCGNVIVRKNLPQWIFRITTYANGLLKGLDGLEWPAGILEMQKNWIGKDKGLQINFNLENSEIQIPVWTKFWETVYGTTFLVIAPEHKLVDRFKEYIQKLPKNEKQENLKQKFHLVDKYIRQALSKTDEQRLKEEKQKSGIFTGLFAINPVNQKKVPIWVADYVLSNVGTGAVMGVPAHDERDFAFAKKHKLEIIQVVKYIDKEINKRVEKKLISFEGEGTLVNSGEFDGLSAWGEGKKRMAKKIVENGIATWQTNYHLRDWIFSRQRYWGEPIPMIFCQKCADSNLSWFSLKEGKEFGNAYQNITKLNQSILNNLAGWFPIESNQLPLELPYLNNYEPTKTGQSPLSKEDNWKYTTCPHCNGKAIRETDTMPNWAGSCWYFLRFPWENGKSEIRNPKSEIETDNDPNSNTEDLDNSIFGSSILSEVRNSKLDASMKEWLANRSFSEGWLPVDWYLGGAEHAVLHLLYSRFWTHALNDLGLLGFREPFKRLRNVGMVLAEDNRKMSKSLGNVINPDVVVKEYGADTLRVYEMFMAPFNIEIAWSTRALRGSFRFLRRTYQLYTTTANIATSTDKESEKLVAKLHKTIKKVSSDITNVKYNTAIAALMEFLNEWETATKGKTNQTLKPENAIIFLKLLAPFAPFLAEELWKAVFKKEGSIHLSSWPVADKNKLINEVVNLPVQINGKLRGIITVNTKIDTEETVVNKALEDQKVNKYLTGKEYKKVYVKGKVLNFILKQ